MLIFLKALIKNMSNSLVHFVVIFLIKKIIRPKSCESEIKNF